MEEKKIITEDASVIFADENIKEKKNDLKIEENSIIKNKIEEQETKKELSNEKVLISNSEELNKGNENDVSKKEKISVENSENQDGLGFSQDLVEEKLKEAYETQNPKKKRKSMIINVCLLLINLIFMFFIVRNLIRDVGDSDINAILANQGNKLWWLLGGILIYILYMFAQTVMYKILIKDFTGESRWWLAYDVAIVGKYYDNITPFAVGGQPLQILRLVKNGVSPGVSTSIPIIKMIMNTAVNAFVALMFFCFGMPLIESASSLNSILLLVFEILGVIGLVITIILVIFMFLISSGSLFTRSFISGVLRIGYKMKLVKDYRKTFKKVLNQVAEYKLSMSYLWKHKALLFKMIFWCMIESLAYALIPYFVIMSFVQPDINSMTFVFLVVCIAKYYICTMASCFIPLPGGTGLIEIAFIFLFGTVVGDAIVFALLAWRILSFYLIIAHGFVHELGQIAYNFRKIKKKEKKV